MNRLFFCRLCFACLLVVLLVLGHVSKGNAQLATTTNLTDSTRPKIIATPWQARSRSEHLTEWFSVRYTTNAATGRVRATTNAFVALATGLNRRDSLGQWQPSSPAFSITERGAEAAFGVHRVQLAADINTAGAVRIEKDGVT